MTTSSSPAQFVARFERAWTARTTAALATLLHPDVRLVQPLSRPLLGRDAALRSLERFIALTPNMRITLHRWSADGALLFIEFSFHGSVGRRAIQLNIVDRIELLDGLVRDRTSYFNPAPLVRALLAQPWLLWGLTKRTLVSPATRQGGHPSS